MFKDDPLSYEHYPFWIDVLDSARLSTNVDMSHRKVVFKCSRQVGKSTNIGVIGAGTSIVRKNFKTLITQPTDVQISRFSVDTLKKLNNDSVVTDKWYYDRKTTERQVKNKSYTTGSRIVLANIYASVLSARGIAADMALFDEYQDIPPENVLVVQNSMGRSPFRFVIYSGTPKGLDNDLEVKWQDSTRNEWVVPCRACGFENGPLGGDGSTKVIKHIGQNGLICEKCHSRIYSEDGRWVMFNPPEEDKPRFIEGFHINELMIPRDAPGATSWAEIKRRIQEEPIVLLMNEMLGVSYDDATQPITLETVMDNCGDHKYVDDINDAHTPAGWYAFGGLDWAMETAPRKGSAVTLKSYTMLSIGLYNPSTNQIKVDFVKKYYDHDTADNDDPDFVVNDIVAWCEAYDVTILGCDYGVGHKENQRLKAILGSDRIMEFQYLGGPLQSFYTYDYATGHWIIGRTQALEDMIDAVKGGEFLFAKYKGETSEYARDLTTLYKHNNALTRSTKYGKRSADDWAHNLTYMLIAKKQAFEELDYTSKNM